MSERQIGFRPEEISSAEAFVDYLWDVIGIEIGHELVTSPLTREAQQAQMARKYLPRWKEISQRLLTSPKSLTFRDSGIEFSEENIQVLPNNPKEPPVNLPLKYSYFHGIVDLDSPNGGIPQTKESAKPQIEFGIKELFRDSRRELHASIVGMEEALSGLGTTWLRESTLGGRDFIQALIRGANSRIVLDISLVGKAVYYDPAIKTFQPLNLLGVRIEVSEDGMALRVEQLMKFLSATFAREFPGTIPSDPLIFMPMLSDLDKKIFKMETLMKKKLSSR